MENNTEMLPLKLILTDENDLQTPAGGGGEQKIFDPDSITPALRKTFVSQVSNIYSTFQPVFSQTPDIPAVARVILKDEAIAKSHRPTALFSALTCPIIGYEKFGSLLISVSPHGLLELAKQFQKETRGAIAAISTLVSIEPYETKNIEHLNMTKGVFRLRLFNHGKSQTTQHLEARLFEMAQSLNIRTPRKLHYTDDLNIFEVCCQDTKTLKELSKFVGTQSIDNFAEFDVEHQSVAIANGILSQFPLPSDDLPIVGLIDSGVSVKNKSIQPWIVDRDEEDVPRCDQDNGHGTFIAGLIANGQELNHGNKSFPKSKARIVDVVAMPKGGTLEYTLLETIKRVIPKYSYVKVWNLSINSKVEMCSDDCFSPFAIALDKLQKQYGVTFINSAGNHSCLRTWPPTGLGQTDRISPPADTALGITVGSVAHLSRDNALVKIEEPSPFSRRGPGAAFLPKPEVCHYGGNVDSFGRYSQLGIISLSSDQGLVERVGTSFAAPLVAVIMSHLRAGNISANLAKALLIHSANLRGDPITQADFIYRGFGIPQDIDIISSCQPWNATMIFEPCLKPVKRLFDKGNFPIPLCLKNSKGGYQGELFVTLVYDPPLLPQAGAEYCQVNIDVSIGRRGKVTADGNMSQKKEIKLQPEDLKDLLESSQLKHGFKWSPVKVYRKRFTNLEGDDWGLRLQILYRDHEGVDREPQNVALIVTIADPERKAPVYNEVVQLINQRGWVSENLNLTTRIRQQVRS